MHSCTRPGHTHESIPTRSRREALGIRPPHPPGPSVHERVYSLFPYLSAPPTLKRFGYLETPQKDIPPSQFPPHLTSKRVQDPTSWVGSGKPQGLPPQAAFHAVHTQKSSSGPWYPLRHSCRATSALDPLLVAVTKGAMAFAYFSAIATLYPQQLHSPHECSSAFVAALFGAQNSQNFP